MSKDLSALMKKLSPRIFSRTLHDSHSNGNGANSENSSQGQQPVHPSALQVMSPTSADGPANPIRTASSPLPTPNFRPPSPLPPPSASPVHTIHNVDQRYPDVIATLSNALHYLNQHGFDHDRVHNHVNHVSVYGFNENENEHEHVDGKAFRVEIERDDFNDDVELDVDVVNLSSPSPVTSEDEWSSDDDDDDENQKSEISNSSASSKTSSNLNAVLSPPSNASFKHSHRRNRSSSSVPGSTEITAASNPAVPTNKSDDTDATPVPTGSGQLPEASPSQSQPSVTIDATAPATHHRVRSNTMDFLSPTTPNRSIDASLTVDTDNQSRTSVSQVSETVSSGYSSTTTTITQTTTETVPPSPTLLRDPEWSLIEQAQLLEEILLFYVDLYWENQQAFSPFYKRKLETWKDKAIMIYRHLFQDKKFKATARYLKPHLIDFFEHQLIGKTTGHPMLQHSNNNPANTIGFHPSHFKFNSRIHSVSNTPPNVMSPEFSEPSSPSSSYHTTRTPDVLSPANAMTSPIQATLRLPLSVSSPIHVHENLPNRPDASATPNASSILTPFPGALLEIAPPGPLVRQQTTEADYFELVNNVVLPLHKKYTIVNQTINTKISLDILKSGALHTTIKNADDLNRAVINILHDREIEALISDYHTAYQQAVVGFPGRVLMSKTLRHRIESVSFLPVNFTDMIVAVNELTEILRKAFQKVASRNPKLIQNLIGSQRLESLRELHLEAAASRARDKAGYPESFSSWLYDSRLYPKLFTDDTFLLLEKVKHLEDARTFHYISEFKLQEALWRLRDLKCDDDAVIFEEAINTYIFTDQHVEAVENLGGGFTTTKLIKFPSPDIKGVYKPKPGSIFGKANFKLQTIKDSMVSNYKKEIAAYKIDKLLKLNHVPITKVASVNGAKGSLQYFINDANSARDLNDVDLHNPLKSGKWTHSRGRTMLPRTIRMFDYFINNRDRNLDNYLISDDGRIILIDHGWTFVAPSSNPSKQFLAKLIPKRDVYENVKALHNDQRRIDAELKDYLSPRNLAAFKRRLKTVVKFVEKQIRLRGVDAVFEEAEREDWKPVL